AKKAKKLEEQDPERYVKGEYSDYIEH
ncbi:hypothetical protein LCGC14_2891350, partial [marine sediment metagenome]